MFHVPNPWTVGYPGDRGTASHFLLEHGTFKDSVSQDVYEAPPLNNYKLTIKTVFIICVIFKTRRLFLIKLPFLEFLVILHLPVM